MKRMTLSQIMNDYKKEKVIKISLKELSQALENSNIYEIKNCFHKLIAIKLE
jgi:hypothetical protein